MARLSTLEKRVVWISALLGLVICAASSRVPVRIEISSQEVLFGNDCTYWMVDALFGLVTTCATSTHGSIMVASKLATPTGLAAEQLTVPAVCQPKLRQRGICELYGHTCDMTA